MFDRFVSGRRPSWTRRSLLIGSLVLHAAVALALAVGSWFHVAELTPPMLAVVFMSVPEQPPPPPPPARPKTPERRVKASRPQPTTPTVAPPTAPQPTPPGEPNPNVDPSDSKDPPGIDPRSTTRSCTGTGCNGPTAPAPKPRNLPPHALDAQRIAGAMPHLPSSVIGARHGLGETTFTARLCVDQSGAVSSVTVLSGIPGADAAIVSTVRGWRYKAQPIPVCFITQFVYNVE